MKWFRLYTDILDDTKLRGLEEGDKWRFICLLATASEHDKEGLIPESIQNVSWRIRCRQDHLEKTIEKLIQLNILKQNENGFIEFTNWRKRQFRSDNVSERVKRYRNVTRNVTETLHETAPETDTEQSRDIYSPQSQSEDSCPHEKIIELYHKILPECSKVKVWSDTRRKKLRSRWREDPKRQELDWWRVYFENVRLCFWFTTENKKNWYPNLEWLVESRNLINVIEKRYFNEIQR
jgi:hypothetical protein